MPQFNHSDGRKHGQASSGGSVYKRGSGTHNGPVGNADYSGRRQGNRNSRMTGGYDRPRRYRRRSGISGIALLIVVFLLIYHVFGTGTSSTGGSTSWNKPETDYVDANSDTVDTSVSSGARDKFTALTGNDQATVLVYMIGSNLESENGMATADLNEMINAVHSDKVNIIVETGGAKQWRNNLVSSSALERWRIRDGGMEHLDDSPGRSMTDPDVLKDFLIWGQQAYPANRYELILWDHGGGSVQGYGYDELYPDGTMSAAEISEALKDSGIQLDILGFDACLMANTVTAAAAAPYADYLIASEETEPGTGWYYTNWLGSLARNSSIPTTSLGKEIIDDYTSASSQSSAMAKTTLSLIDLAEFDYLVPSDLKTFAQKLTADINDGSYKYISDARSTAHEFSSSSRLDQIDLVHFAKNLNTSESLALADSVQKCVKYNRANRITNAYGLSIYFPYANTRLASQAADIYNEVNPDSTYADTIRSFATLEASGQLAASSSSNSLFDILNGSSVQNTSFSFDSSDILNLLLNGSGSSGLLSLLGGRSAVNEDRLNTYSSYLSDTSNHIDTGSLVFTEKNGNQVLELEQDQWNLIQNINLNVWADDGSGYIDLGLDNIYHFDDDGDLVAEYDGTWISLNDHIVSYYMLSDEEDINGEEVISGYVPVLLNGSRADILLEFTDEEPDGSVLGARMLNDNGTEDKGLKAIEDGDAIDFLCDYYDYDGNYQDSYYLGEQLTVNHGLTVGTYQISGTSLLYGYQLNDIYNSTLWTPMLAYTE